MATPTRVDVSIGYTTNMGNYESLPVRIGIADDVRSDESIDQTLDRVQAKVEERLMAIVTGVREDLKNIGK